MTILAPTLEAFFTQRLIAQRHASPNTIAAYRDTFRLLLAFIQQATGTPPSKLHLETLDAPLIGAFLDHLQQQRGVAVTTRNARLAAIHSLFGYAALHHPDHAAVIQRVLAIPTKRAPKPDVWRSISGLWPGRGRCLSRRPSEAGRAEVSYSCCSYEEVLGWQGRASCRPRCGSSRRRLSENQQPWSRGLSAAPASP